LAGAAAALFWHIETELGKLLKPHWIAEFKAKMSPPDIKDSVMVGKDTWPLYHWLSAALEQ
jgi:hypothetical protein